MSPAPTIEVIVPSALPRSESGNASVTMAFAFAIASDTPTACTSLSAMTCSSDCANEAAVSASVRIAHPAR